jgi:hypothetical protein
MAGKDVRFHIRPIVRLAPGGRLETLRRAGIVEQIDADHWRISGDFENRAADYDAQHRGRMSIRLLSDLDLESQIGADGSTGS